MSILYLEYTWIVNWKKQKKLIFFPFSGNLNNRINLNIYRRELSIIPFFAELFVFQFLGYFKNRINFNIYRRELEIIPFFAEFLWL